MAADSGLRRARLRPAIVTTVMLVIAALAGAVSTSRSSAAAAPLRASAAGTSTAAGTNYATSAHTAYLRAHAAGDHMGESLSGGRSAPARGAAHPATPRGVDPVLGDDVSSKQGPNVDWKHAASTGTHFVFVKATEGTYYKNPDFVKDYGGAYYGGMIHGAYAFAIPSYSSGASQAAYFARNGGGWSADGRTLPGVLDIEFNPYGKRWCYGMSTTAMVSWIRSFVNEYHGQTGRWAVIYTNYRWWSRCTGNYGGFAANDPLWIANYGHNAGTLPAGWSNYTFWQYADSGTFPGDQDVFLGAPGRLRALADNK
jgi:GH25 family lysozyme M1 (1,4-beta-N-acetylmuramidase)